MCYISKCSSVILSYSLKNIRMSITRTEVLKLYKNLLSYSKTLAFTDIAYYRRRINHEFLKNKTLTKPEDIRYAFKKGQALLQRGSIV